MWAMLRFGVFNTRISQLSSIRSQAFRDLGRWSVDFCLIPAVLFQLFLSWYFWMERIASHMWIAWEDVGTSAISANMCKLFLFDVFFFFVAFASKPVQGFKKTSPRYPSIFFPQLNRTIAKGISDRLSRQASCALARLAKMEGSGRYRRSHEY